jgi:tetratricopeptide (TPR) repeat protein
MDRIWSAKYGEARCRSSFALATSNRLGSEAAHATESMRCVVGDFFYRIVIAQIALYPRSYDEKQPRMRKDLLLSCAALALAIMQGCGPQTKDSQHHTISSNKLPIPPPSQSETLALLNAGQFVELDARFSAVQAEYRNSVISDEQLRDAFRVFYDTEPALRAQYDAWVAKFPKSYASHLARGIYYKKVGEMRRGGKFISDTTDDQLQGMDDAFARATQDFTISEALEERPLLTFLNEMSIAAYDGDESKIRASLEKSLKVDPQNVIVRHNYMGSLEPRWGGSVEQMTAFLEESRNAGLSTPKLQLLEAVIITDRADGYRNAGDYSSAEREYRRAVALGSDDCLKCLANVLLLQNKREDAIPVLSRVVNEDPSDGDTLVLRGQTYLSLGNMSAGTADMIAAARLGNAAAENAVAIYYMAGANGITRDPETGLAWFRKCADQGNVQCAENVKRAQALHGNPPP